MWQPTSKKRGEEQAGVSRECADLEEGVHWLLCQGSQRATDLVGDLPETRAPGPRGAWQHVLGLIAIDRALIIRQADVSHHISHFSFVALWVVCQQKPGKFSVGLRVTLRRYGLGCRAVQAPMPRSLQNARASAPLTRGAARAQIKNPDKGPTLRTGHSLVVSGLPNNPKAVIIGGCTAEGVVNEGWNLKLGVETLEWEKPKIGQPDKAPSPRWRHTANLLRASPRARQTAGSRPGVHA